MKAIAKHWALGTIVLGATAIGLGVAALTGGGVVGAVYGAIIAALVLCDLLLFVKPASFPDDKSLPSRGE
jgi:hypothetical protein